MQEKILRTLPQKILQRITCSDKRKTNLEMSFMSQDLLLCCVSTKGNARQGEWQCLVQCFAGNWSSAQFKSLSHGIDNHHH
mmetsp:Transcript_17571/g.42886  ORF Transcript_17571/g.42886 Transcript_17571/m.42886 type:complete len:81 (-) Transcript_17571:896-1138(-)